ILLQVFEANVAKSLAYHQIEVERICQEDGWVEQDPMIILNTAYLCIEKTAEKMRALGLNPSDIKAIGVTNQRETVVAWDRITGEPLYNAIGNDN
ncbi:unnamed protein product, partial [Allacma fusca]